MNLHVWLDTAKNPHRAMSNQSTHLKFPMGAKKKPPTRQTVTEIRPSEQLRYQETTASWNFFILRIAIAPPAIMNGFNTSAPYMTQTKVGPITEDESADYPFAKTTTTIIPLTSKTIIRTSKHLMRSLRMRKAKMRVTSGLMLLMMEIIVSGTQAVAEKLMILEKQPCMERKKRGPAEARSTPSQTAALSALL